MTRAEFLARTDALIAEGDRLATEPDFDAFRAWLIESDQLLELVWGRMDRYHLAWLNVGRDSAPPGSPAGRGGDRPLRDRGVARQGGRPAYDAHLGGAPGLAAPVR